MRFGSKGNGEMAVSIAADEEGSIRRLQVGGILDAEGCEELDRALDEALRSGSERIVLELGGLRYVDPDGLDLLRRATDSADGRVQLAWGGGPVAEMADLALLDG